MIEDTIEDLRVTGWGNNPFFREYVDERNIALGDVNDFYVEDNSLLTISKFLRQPPRSAPSETWRWRVLLHQDQLVRR